jgi:hypothetical protein
MGHSIHVLCNEDLIGFAALHLLLHVLHGECPLQRAWEIANFLHRHASDDDFWRSWRELHAGPLRQLEVIVFQLLKIWFRCDVAQPLEIAAAEFPSRVRSWLEQFSWSPLEREFRANKEELWLHLALVDSFEHRIQILMRRLFPMATPGFADRASGACPADNISRFFRQSGLLLSRAAHHSSTLVPTVYQGLRWMWERE